MLPNVGFGELMLVLVIGLIVVGPQRLPEVARAAAKAWRTFQLETGKAKAALREAIDEPTRDLREAFAEPQAEVRASIEETRKLAGVFDRPDGMPAPKPDPHARPELSAPPAPAVAPVPPVDASPDVLPVVREWEDT